MAVLHGFHMVVDLYRDHARLARDIAAQHQYHAKFAHGVGKGQHGSGDKAGAGQRQGHGEKAVDGAGAQAGCGFHGARPQRFKSALQRLHGKGHGIDQRADDQAGKGKWQTAQAQPFGELAHRPIGAHDDEQVKADDRGRQHQGQGHHGGNGPGPARACMCQPPGQRCTQQHQQYRGHPRKLESEPDGRVVFGVQLHKVKKRPLVSQLSREAPRAERRVASEAYR